MLREWAVRRGTGTASGHPRVGYDRAEQIREGVSGDGLEENFWEEGLPPCIQSQLECLHGWSVHNLLNYSDAERMLTASVFTPLLVNLESMTSKSNAGGGSKDCVTWKVEEDPCTKKLWEH